MPLSELIKHNFWLKCFALLLATLTWFAIRFQIGVSQRPANAVVTHQFKHMRVTMLKDGADTQNYQIVPNEVNVTVSGEEGVLRHISGKDIPVFVNLMDMGEVRNSIKPVAVHCPPGVSLYLIEPAVVRVDLATNSLALPPSKTR